MYRDIIHYQLAENTSEQHLLKVAQKIIDDWMKQQPGFISWEIHKNEDSSYTDIVSWENKSDAKNAEKEMINIPNAQSWFACYKEGSISSSNLTLISKF